MQHRKHDCLPRFYAVEDRIWKAVEDCAPHISVHDRKDVWVALDGIECGFNGGEKPLAEPSALTFVVTEACREVPPDLGAEDDRL